MAAGDSLDRSDVSRSRYLPVPMQGNKIAPSVYEAVHMHRCGLGCVYRFRPRDLWHVQTMCRSKATLNDRRTRNDRAVQLLPEHTNLVNPVQYLCNEVDDELEMA